MRPAKHVTHSHSAESQEIFDIAMARADTGRGAVPVVATSESGAITLFAWDDDAARWRSTGVAHATIEAPRGPPAITNTWNWSRQVGLATLDNRVFAVYKRADKVGAPDSSPSPQLMLETFRIEPGRDPVREIRIPVAMAWFLQAGSGVIHVDVPVSETCGFELWTGIDLPRRELLIVAQTLGDGATDDGDGAKLKLGRASLDRLDSMDAWTWTILDDGGYGLDVRQEDEQLTLVYRSTASAVTIPLPLFQIDAPFGPSRLDLDASVASDRFHAPLRLMHLDLATNAKRILDLPGGEHPRIENLDPLLIVADRPRLNVRFLVSEDTTGAIQPQIAWNIAGIEKLALLLDDTWRIARGTLIAVADGVRPTFPRTAAPWATVQDLHTDLRRDGIGWSSTFSRLPLEPLVVGSDAKGLFFDFLHKSPHVALQRSRARLAADFARGQLNVSDLSGVVYDINHAQIDAPERIRPDATGENAQFAPFGPFTQPTDGTQLLPSYVADNTIGGALATDRGGVPYRFVAYTDLGDGGLRVIYADDLRPPDVPPPMTNKKVLGAESVPGPGIAGEQWIDLTAENWQNAGVPAITLPDLLHQGTVTSSVHAQIESLLLAGVELAHLAVDEENGWSEDDVNSIQTSLNQLSIFDTRTIPSDDGLIPPSFIGISPRTVVAEAENVWTAGVEGMTATIVNWRFVFPGNGPAPTTTLATGNGIAVALPQDGDCSVRADITLADGTTRTVRATVPVDGSLFRNISRLHKGLSDRGLDPPLSSLGGFRIGTATFSLLEYELRFPVEPEAARAARIVIRKTGATDAQWRFRGDRNRQGVVDYRLHVRFDTEDIRLSGLLASLVHVDRVSAAFFYGRALTPGILMNDTRSAVPSTGAKSSIDGLRRGVDSDVVPRLASVLTARPFGDAAVSDVSATAVVSTLPQAAVAGIVTLLLGLGATAAATTLLTLLAALGVAAAAAALPLVGAVASAAAVAAAVAVALFVALVVPRIVASTIEGKVRTSLTDARMLTDLEGARLLQFAGEGVAESIARQVITKAIDNGVQTDPPPEDPALIGDSRFRQDFFRMIHVLNGRCRVLIGELRRRP